MTSIDKLKQIRAVILDIDGVLTDGRVGFSGDNLEEIKFFDVKDGHAIRMLSRAGFKIGALTGRSSRINERRARELELDFLYQNAKVKLDKFMQLLEEQSLTAEQCLYIGDDVIDLPVMRRCAIGVAVADATPETLALADWVTTARGGRGAIREVVTELLKAQGLYEEALKRYLV